MVQWRGTRTTPHGGHIPEAMPAGAPSAPKASHEPVAPQPHTGAGASTGSDDSGSERGLRSDTANATYRR